MEDKELLELAAKADGKCLSWMTNNKACFVGDEIWSPLDDDCDAFRLAVSLKLFVHSFEESICGFPLDNDGVLFNEIYEPHGNDPYAATRRAIVRAAAEIGKAMP